MTKIEGYIYDCDYEPIMNVLEKNGASLYDLGEVIAENLKEICELADWEY